MPQHSPSALTFSKVKSGSYFFDLDNIDHQKHEVQRDKRVMSEYEVLQTLTASRRMCIAANMDKLLDSLLVPTQDGLVPASTASKQRQSSQTTMAAAAVTSSPLSPNLSFRNRTHVFEENASIAPPSGQKQNDENAAPDLSATGLGAVRNHQRIEEAIGFGAMANLQSIEDFDRDNPYDPNAKKPKLVPLASSKGDSGNSVKFQELCNLYGYRPEYTYTQSPHGFTVKVEFGTHTVEINEPHLSKKQAKEAVCKLAVLYLPEHKKGIKRKSSETATTVESEVDRSENWVSILNENAQQKKAFVPHYQEYATESFPIQFGCTIEIIGGPLTPFGRGLGPFNTKSDAKVAAAKQAVLWLRSAGLLKTPAKRQKVGQSPPSERLPGHCGLTQDVEDIDVDRESSNSPTSYAQEMHKLVATLGLLTPKWHCVKSSSASAPPTPYSALFDAALYFHEKDVSTEPRLAGPIGKVERILGQKAAKEESCKKVLPLLEKIQRTRLPC